MPDETTNNPIPPTSTASPQGAPAVTPPTQSGNLSDRIAAMAFPEGKPLPFTAKQAEEVEKKQAEAVKAQPSTAPTSPPAGEDETPPVGLSDAGKASWKQWKAAEKAKYVELETKWKAANQELETIKKTPQTKVEIKAPDDYEEIKKREAEYSDRLKLLDLQNHPDFQRHFNSKYDPIFGTAKEIGGEKLVNALKLPDSPEKNKIIEEIYSELPAFLQGQVGQVVLELKKVNSEKEMELSKGKENYAKFISMQQENQRKQQEQARLQADRVFNSEIENATKNLPVFQKVEGNNEWNQKIDESLKIARQIFAGDLPLPELARAATWAAAAPLILQDSAAKGEQIKNLTAEITRLKGAQPKPGGGTDQKESQVPANLSLSDRIVWQAQQAGAVR